MDLHRTTGKPDWEKISANDYNYWQRLASKTHGYVTPANAVTFFGLMLVLISLVLIRRGDYWVSIILLIVGRLADIADGWLAEYTKTKGPVGEFLDAGTDKVSTFLTIIVLYTSDVVGTFVLLAIAISQLLILALTTYYYFKKKKLHPSRAGKISMATAWLALILGVLMNALGTTSHASSQWDVAVFAVLSVVVSVVTGLISATGYILQKRD